MERVPPALTSSVNSFLAVSRLSALRIQRSLAPVASPVPGLRTVMVNVTTSPALGVVGLRLISAEARLKSGFGVIRVIVVVVVGVGRTVVVLTTVVGDVEVVGAVVIGDTVVVGVLVIVVGVGETVVVGAFTISVVVDGVMVVGRGVLIAVVGALTISVAVVGAIVPMGVFGSRTVVGVRAADPVGVVTGVLLMVVSVTVGDTVGVGAVGVVVRVGSVAVGADGVTPGIVGGEGVTAVVGGGVTVVVGGGVTLVTPGMLGAVFAVGAGDGGGAGGC